MSISKNDDELLISRISDLYEQSAQWHKPAFTKFLNEQEISVCLAALKSFGITDYTLYGGYEGCQRAVLGFGAEPSDFPITAIEFTHRRQDRIRHPQMLGTILSTGLDRSVVGDIICRDGCTTVFVLSNQCDYIMSRVDKVAGIGVKSKKADLSCFEYTPEFKELYFTVASLRLDNLVAAVTGLSREKTASLIMSGAVFKNQVQMLNVSEKLQTGDTVSVRKYGKFILFGIGSLTKKGRIKISVKQFI